MYHYVIGECQASAESVQVFYHVINVEIEEKWAGDASLHDSNVCFYALIAYLELHTLVEVPRCCD